MRRVTLRGIIRRVRTLGGKVRELSQLRTVGIDRILRGGEGGIPAATYARLTDDLLRPSTPITRGPHVAFLRDYAREGPALLKDGRLEQTAYFRNAAACVDALGFYFPYIKDKSMIRRAAERFVQQFVHGISCPADAGHSDRSSPIELRPIWQSDTFELVDGNHRIAAATMRGETHVRAIVRGRCVQTPMQSLLMDVLWQQGRIELYQPVDLPEVSSWTLVRRCTDRFELMAQHLAREGIGSGRYLDVGSSYGWFVGKMQTAGFEAQGIELDPASIRIGELLYGVRPGSVRRGEMARQLRGMNECFDVVSCFSVLHHFALGRMSIDAEELMRRLDAITGRILFFETAQSHELWFRNSLREWNLAFIKDFITRNSGFRRVVPLGEDKDGVGKFRGNYGRTLWACMR